MQRQSDILVVEVLRSPDRAVVRVEGEIDLLTAPRLRAALNDVFVERPVGVEIDLSAVTLITTDGLRTLLAARRRWLAARRPFEVSRPSRHVVRALALTGLRSVFGIPVQPGGALPVPA